MFVDGKLWWGGWRRRGKWLLLLLLQLFPLPSSRPLLACCSFIRYTCDRHPVSCWLINLAFLFYSPIPCSLFDLFLYSRACTWRSSPQQLVPRCSTTVTSQRAAVQWRIWINPCKRRNICILIHFRNVRTFRSGKEMAPREVIFLRYSRVYSDQVTKCQE